MAKYLPSLGFEPGFFSLQSPGSCTITTLHSDTTRTDPSPPVWSEPFCARGWERKRGEERSSACATWTQLGHQKIFCPTPEFIC